MKISIITVSYNSEKTIEDTIKSVLGQKYPDFEYIIVDGGSTDSTLQIVDKYKDKIQQFVSESDNGLYDAMNKGIKMAQGEIIGILNSDDYFQNNDVLSIVVNNIGDADGVYGNLMYVARENKILVKRIWKPGAYSSKKLDYGWAPPHPALFLRKSVYDRLGVFNTGLKLAADYELFLRLMKNKVVLRYVNEFFVCMRDGGISGKNLRQRMKGWKEISQAWRLNSLTPPMFLFLRRTFSKLNQFIIK